MAAENSSAAEELSRLRGRVAELESQLADKASVERELEDYRERWRRVVENSPDVILLIDRGGVIDYISRPRRPAEDVLGTVSFDYLTDEHRHAMQSNVMHVFTTGESVSGEIQAKDEGLWFSVRLAPLMIEGRTESVVAICTDITQQKLREQELRDNQARLQLLLRQLPAIVFTIDRDLRFSSSRGGGLEGLGLKPNEVVGRSLYEYFGAEDDSVRPIKAIKNALAGESDDYEFTYQGNVYETLVEPLRDAEGRIEGALGVALDITDRRRMESTLQESEERLRQMAEAIQDVFYLVDSRQRKILYVSPAYEQIWGLSRSEVYDDIEAWTRSIHPDDRDVVVKDLHALLNGSGELRARFRIQRPNGETRWIEDRRFIIRNDAGVPVRIAGVGCDITERKQAEETLLDAHNKLERRVAERTRDLRAANRQLREDIEERKRIAAKLQESEARFRVLVEDSPIPVGITEPGEGKLLYVNPRLADFFGIPEDELIGRRVTEFYEEPDDRTALLETMHRDGFVRDCDIRLRRADGELIWASISMSNIDYDGGKCFYAGLVDVTKTKQAEESLRAERRLLKRLLELHERDRQLIAYEIHDGIVQDMTAAGMFVEAALHAIPDKPDVCNRLEQSAKLLRGSIDEARRMINGLRPPILEDEGLVAAIENLVDEISSRADLEIDLRHNVQFDRIAPALEMAIYRVVQEGLNNVWQHSGSHAARIEMNQQGEEVRITVQDWGSGFDPTKVTAKRYGLLGIRERARLLGGRAQISSSPGQGTRIDVSLPLSDVLLP